MLYVDPKTVTRWAVEGKVASVRTPGGHHRFFQRPTIADRRRTVRAPRQSTTGPATEV